MTMRKQYTAAFKTQLVREVLKEEKPLNQIASEHGVHRNLLAEWRDQALAALPGVFSHQAQRDQEAKAAAHEQHIHELYAEIGRLSTQLAWLKKKLVTCLTRAERLTLLECDTAELPLTTQTNLLSLNRSSLYYRSVVPSPKEVALKHRIDEIYTERPYYGVRRITAQLRREGVVVNHKAVGRHMREMG